MFCLAKVWSFQDHCQVTKVCIYIFSQTSSNRIWDLIVNSFWCRLNQFDIIMNFWIVKAFSNTETGVFGILSTILFSQNFVNQTTLENLHPSKYSFPMIKNYTRNLIIIKNLSWNIATRHGGSAVVIWRPHSKYRNFCNLFTYWRSLST